MIHLGEERYIDTSLVTCAEYQLFSNERGSFHRPDHWKTSPFPQGQGRTPVLGVRLSDALAFCAWLTESDRSQTWQYRLPTLDEQKYLEANKILTIFSQESVGYWIEDGLEFAWIRNLPPPTEPIIDMTQEVLKHNLVELPPHSLSRACNRTRTLDLERIWARISALKLENVVDPTLSHARILTEARFANHAYARRLVESLTSDRVAICTLTRTLEQKITRALTRTHYGTVDRTLSCSCELVGILNRVQDLDLEGHETLMYAYECCLDLVVSLVLFNARLKDEQPAREGILLARSRKFLIPA